MVSDLLKILQALQAAQSAEEKDRLEQELRVAVAADIRALFAEYPNRRRTFGAIRGNLGIFDPPEKQEELKAILYAMGARPKSGEGDTKYWHLPADTGTDVSIDDTPPRPAWTLIYGLVLIAFLGAAAFGVFQFDLLGSSAPSYASFAECVADQPNDQGIPEWRIHCTNLQY
jgi:hypothetical protein